MLFMVYAKHNRAEVLNSNTLPTGLIFDHPSEKPTMLN